MLSATSEYGVRALIRLARLAPGTAMLGRDVAAEAGIPANYLSKILLVLRNAGILATARGTGGATGSGGRQRASACWKSSTFSTALARGRPVFLASA
jgi:hypothetical protein